MNNYFSTNLKYLRKKQRLTQQQLADIVGKKKSIVGNYEKGNVEPSMETIQKIADYFTINWMSLLGTDFTLTSANVTKTDDNHATVSVTTIATINELVGLRKENAQKDKKIEKLEAQILALKQTQTK